MTLTLAAAEKVLADNFAPWVLDLGLTVASVDGQEAVLRLPWSERLAREGGGLSGQALMAAADTATVLAVAAARGGFVPMTTVQQSISFQRAVVGADVLVRARLTKAGRRMAFADITMTAEGSEETAAHATAVYALLG
ncbi:thioesterase [Streptomyces platensis subsp. clarensis]|uniref:Thioesterase n=1 Tax=Streptomyces showdoensis TaxID=68268 RepID=A0A2P2GH76_STREW|nr:PaaI family thioesterase [Streptomyces showdoensis]KKZ70858.1 thioesterase [Streptomyces showdoensis]MCW7991277.1 thioesterase [Streptomyces platensis subsp. clarensis]